MAVLISLTTVSVVVFVAAFWWFGVVRVARAAINTMTGAVAALNDSSLDEYGREKAAQTAGLQLVRSAASILIRSLATLLLASLPFFIADLLGVVPKDVALDFLTRWDVIVVTSVVTLVIWLVGGRFWQKR